MVAASERLGREQRRLDDALPSSRLIAGVDRSNSAAG
jgi:hypothetical protein